MDLNARAVLSAQVPACPCSLSGVGSGHQTLSLRLVRRLQCPGFIAGTLQLSNNAICSAVTLWNWRAIAVSPDSGQWSASRRLQRPCPPPRRIRRETRHTLADGRNLSLTAYPALTSALSDSLVWLNVSPAAARLWTGPAYDLPSDPTDCRQDQRFVEIGQG